MRAYETWQKTQRPQILFYFKNKAFTPGTSEEISQLQQVVAFKERFPPEGLYWGFRTAADSERLVRGHLTKIVRARSETPVETREGKHLRAPHAAHRTRCPSRSTIPDWTSNRSCRWHSDWIWSVAFSQNGMLVASGGSNGKIVLLSVSEATAGVAAADLPRTDA